MHCASWMWDLSCVNICVLFCFLLHSDFLCLVIVPLTRILVCASLILSFFSSPSTLCCMWLPQGVKGQPGEKVSPHFALHSSAPVSSPWTLGDPSRGPHLSNSPRPARRPQHSALTGSPGPVSRPLTPV